MLGRQRTPVVCDEGEGAGKRDYDDTIGQENGLNHSVNHWFFSHRSIERKGKTIRRFLCSLAFFELNPAIDRNDENSSLDIWSR